MENKTKPPSKNPLIPRQNSLTKVLNLFNLAEHENSAEEALAEFKDYTTQLKKDGKEFIENLKELSPVKLNFNRLRASAASTAEITFSVINQIQIPTDESITKWVSINNDLEEFLKSFNSQVLEGLDLQYQQIEENHKELEPLLPKTELYGHYLPPELAQVDSANLSKINMVKDQYNELIGFIQKSPLEYKIQNDKIINIKNKLAQLDISTSNQKDLKDEKEEDLKYEKKVHSLGKHKIHAADSDIPEKDNLPQFIKKTNELYADIVAAQKEFWKALKGFPNQLSAPPDLRKAIESLRKLNQNIQQLIIYPDPENINLTKYKKIITNSTNNFKQIEELLSYRYKTIRDNYLNIFGSSSTDEDILKLIKECHVIKDFIEKFPCTVQQNRMTMLEGMIKDLNLKIENSKKLTLDSSKKSSPEDSKLSTNSNRFSYNDNSLVATAAPTSEATPEKAKNLLEITKS